MSFNIRQKSRYRKVFAGLANRCMIDSHGKFENLITCKNRHNDGQGSHIFPMQSINIQFRLS